MDSSCIYGSAVFIYNIAMPSAKNKTTFAFFSLSNP